MFGAAASSFMLCPVATCLLKIQILIDCTKRFWTVTTWSQASSPLPARTWSRKFWTQTPKHASQSKISGSMSGSPRWNLMIWKVSLSGKTQFQLLMRPWSLWWGICVTRLLRLGITLSCLWQTLISTIRHPSSYRTTSTTRWLQPITCFWRRWRGRPGGTMSSSRSSPTSLSVTQIAWAIYPLSTLGHQGVDLRLRAFTRCPLLNRTIIIRSWIRQLWLDRGFSAELEPLTVG